MTWTKKLMPPEMNEAKNSFFALEERERDRKVDQWTNLRLGSVVLFGGRFLLKSKKLLVVRFLKRVVIGYDDFFSCLLSLFLPQPAQLSSIHF